MTKAETEDQEIWYRFEDRRYSVTIDPELEIYGTRCTTALLEFVVVKRTPKGVRLAHRPQGPFVPSDTYLVLESSNKKFACPTIELALESYEARKARQIKIYTTRIENAKEHLDSARHIAARKMRDHNLTKN